MCRPVIQWLGDRSRRLGLAWTFPGLSRSLPIPGHDQQEWSHCWQLARPLPNFQCRRGAGGGRSQLRVGLHTTTSLLFLGQASLPETSQEFPAGTDSLSMFQGLFPMSL